VNAMLLNEFLKEHRNGEERNAAIDQLNAAVAEQRKQIRALTVSLKEQAAQIHKVNEQLVAIAAPRLLANEH